MKVGISGWPLRVGFYIIIPRWEMYCLKCRCTFSRVIAPILLLGSELETRRTGMGLHPTGFADIWQQ